MSRLIEKRVVEKRKKREKQTLVTRYIRYNTRISVHLVSVIFYNFFNHSIPMIIVKLDNSSLKKTCQA